MFLIRFLVEMKECKLYLKTFQFSQLNEVIAFIKKYKLYDPENPTIYFSGVGSSRLKDEINVVAGQDFKIVKRIEFEVQAKGIHIYLN